MTDRTHTVGFNRDNVQSVSVHRKKLDFIGRTIIVDVNNRANIPRLQVMFRQISQQDSAFMFFDHIHFPSSGYAVTKRGALYLGDRVHPYQAAEG